MTLPKEFAELEQYVGEWDLPTANARYEKRFASSLEDLQPFYDAMKKYGYAIRDHLDSIPLSEFRETEKCLARLMFTFGIIAPAIEVFHSPIIPDSGATNFKIIRDRELN